VVPCYNYGRYLPELITGLLDQPGVDVDVLIVDDASPDGSGDVAETLAERDPRVSVLRHAVNRGHIQTYNDGLAQVTGDYVVLLSADDLLPPWALTRAVSLLEAHPRVGLVYGFARSFSGEPPTAVATVRNWSVWRGREWLGLSVRRARCFISSPEVVMRREALVQAGSYDPRLPHSGDLDLWLRTALHWDIGRVNGPDQALYRVHDSNMHLTTYAGWLTDLQERRTTFELLFDEHAPDRPEVTALRPALQRALARESLHRALRAHRDSAPRGAVHDHLEFALETDPGIRSSVLWALCEWGPLRDRAFPAAAARRFASKVRHHLGWRFERRYGT
jgi:hypothetical protein